MGSQHRYVKHFPGQYVGSSHTSADHGGSCAVKTCIRALSPAKAEFHDAVALGGIDNPGRLGSDQALVVDNI